MIKLWNSIQNQRKASTSTSWNFHEVSSHYKCEYIFRHNCLWIFAATKESRMRLTIINSLKIKSNYTSANVVPPKQYFSIKKLAKLIESYSWIKCFQLLICHWTLWVESFDAVDKSNKVYICQSKKNENRSNEMAFNIFRTECINQVKFQVFTIC